MESDGKLVAGDTVDTVDRLLDVAERLVQTRGYNGFSYADVARELAVTKAALHYHFATKAILGEALIRRYSERFSAALARADGAHATADARLGAYANLYLDVVRSGRMCLCGMLAAEYQTLPGIMQAAVMDFFDENERWLERVIETGRTDGTIRFDGSPAQAARLIVSELQGAMLLARLRGEPNDLESAVRQIAVTYGSSQRS